MTEWTDHIRIPPPFGRHGQKLPGLSGMLLIAGFLIVFVCVSARGTGSALWPEAPGTVVESSGKLTMDCSNLTEGYFTASAAGGGAHRLKLRVEKDGMTLTYDLNGEGTPEVFPLQLGSGSYAVSLYENVGGKKYAQQGAVNLDVTLNREDAAFLYPNQYVNYSQISPLVERALQICEGMDDMQAYQAVCELMQSEFAYDFIRALTVTAGELPDADGCYEKKMGICQDLSAVTAAMLRTLQIPARMMIGYADDNYHAWTQTIVDGQEMFFDPTAALGGINTVTDYSVERYY